MLFSEEVRNSYTMVARLYEEIIQLGSKLRVASSICQLKYTFATLLKT